jgi:hypothetical protein
VRGAAVELGGDPRHGDERERGGDGVELQFPEPGGLVQVGVAQEVDRHPRDDQLVHGQLLKECCFVAHLITRRRPAFDNGPRLEVKTASHLDRYAERVLGRRRLRLS